MRSFAGDTAASVFIRRGRCCGRRVGSGLVISWAGMRGIVSLAAAMALPAAFPYRDLIVLTAFAVVLGTLVIQGLTLKPLLRALDLRDDDPVQRELNAARERALEAALASLADDHSSAAETVRQALTERFRRDDETVSGAVGPTQTIGEVYRRAIPAARRSVIAMRDAGEVGDDAFHRIEEELDQLEIAVGPGAG